MDESLIGRNPKLHTLVTKSNSGNFTYDGIELGGERVCQAIEEEIEKLSRAGQKVTRLSLVGYSLGGLVARYTIGLLDSKGLFDKVEPVVSWFRSLESYKWLSGLELHDIRSSTSRSSSTLARMRTRTSIVLRTTNAFCQALTKRLHRKEWCPLRSSEKARSPLH